MRKFLRNAVLFTLFAFLLCGAVSAQTNGSNKPQTQVEEPITYQTAVAVWTEVQPMFWPGLRMTVDDLLVTYFRDDEGEIIKLGGNQYRAEMRGCIAIAVVITGL